MEDAKEIVLRRRPSLLGKREKEINDFLESGYDMAELATYSDNIASDRSAYSAVIRRTGYPVKILARDGRLFVITIPAYRSLRGQAISYTVKVVSVPWYICLARDVIGQLDYAPPDDIENIVNSALDSLSKREQLVITQRYVEQKTLAEIGFGLNVSRERVRQILLAALKKLRRPHLKRLLLTGQADATAADDILTGWELKTPISDIGLSQRAYNILRRRTVAETVGDLLKVKAEKGDQGFAEWLMSMNQIGKGTAEEIITCLEKVIPNPSKEVGL